MQFYIGCGAKLSYPPPKITPTQERVGGGFEDQCPNKKIKVHLSTHPPPVQREGERKPDTYDIFLAAAGVSPRDSTTGREDAAFQWPCWRALQVFGPTMPSELSPAAVW